MQPDNISQPSNRSEGKNMSLPRTEEELAQYTRTLAHAGFGAPSVVSTACPGCKTRFAMLAMYGPGGWLLRCTLCRTGRRGELKEKQKCSQTDRASHPGREKGKDNEKITQ
jgi:hypothetical protein